MDVKKIRQGMYESYLRVMNFMRKPALDFDAWMVQRGFGYDPIDKMWVRVW